jgi:WD40 repeat protein
MPIATTCPHCYAKYKGVNDRLAGKELPCRRCGKKFLVQPDPEESFSPAATVPVPRRVGPSKESPSVSAAQKPAMTAPSPAREPAVTVAGPAAASAESPSAITSATDWSIGQVVLGLYEVTGFLGQGGMGQVYKVRHREWGVELAVKTSRPESLSAVGGVEKFEQEAETWVNLGLHPHVVSCYYIRRVDGIPCVFAEYVSGGSLHDWIAPGVGEAGRLYSGGPDKTLLRLLDMSIQFAWGLKYSHDQGLIHLDIKPANVMVTTDGLAKVTDFGLALAAGQIVSREGTNTPGPLPGTPQYFSPEQAAGSSTTLHTDMWSYGLCLLEMFKGGRTWESGTVADAALNEYLSAGPDQPWLPPMPDGLVDLLKSIFKADINERPQNMNQVADTLKDVYKNVAKADYPREIPRSGRDTADSLNNRAISLLDLGRAKEAEALWDQALKAQPHHVEATYNLGLIKWRKGVITDEDLARDMMEAIRSHQGSPAALYLRALVHLERDDCQSALRFIKGLPPQETSRTDVQSARTAAETRFRRSNRLIRTYEGHTGSVQAVSFTSNGKYILSGGEDRAVKLWDLKTGRQMRQFKALGQVNTAVLSLDGKTALSAGGDFTSKNFSLQGWDIVKGEEKFALPGHTATVNQVVLTPDEKFAVSVSDDRTIRMWDLNQQKQTRVLKGHRSAVTSVTISPGGQVAYTGGADRQIMVWDLNTFSSVKTLEGHQGRITSLSITTDGKHLLSAAADNTIRLWNLDSGEVTVIQGHSEDVNQAIITPDGKFAVSASSDRTMRLWDLHTLRCLRTFEGHGSWVLCVGLSRDGKFAVTGGVDKTVRVWKVDGLASTYHAPMTLSRVSSSEKTFSARDEYEKHLGAAKAFLGRDNPAAAADRIRAARSQPGYHRAAEAMELWSRMYLHLPKTAFSGGWEDQELSLPETEMESVALGPGARLAASGSSDKTVRLWDLTESRLVSTLEGHESDIGTISFSPNGRFLLSGSTDTTIRVWGVDEAEEILCFKGHQAKVNAVKAGPDNLTALSGDDAGRLLVWRLDTGEILGELTGHKTPTNDISISLNGRLALTGSGDYTPTENDLKLWDLKTGECLRTLTGHERAVNAVRIGPAVALAVSGSAGGEIRQWDLATGECLKTIKGHDSAVLALDLSLDAKYLASSGYDGMVKLWDLTDGKCLRSFEGHTAPVPGVSLSLDQRYILSGSRDGGLKLWLLDWELGLPPEGVWDPAASVYMEAFITARNLSPDDLSFNNMADLMYLLGCAGYGAITPDVVRHWLSKLKQPDAPGPSEPDSDAGGPAHLPKGKQKKKGLRGLFSKK